MCSGRFKEWPPSPVEPVLHCAVRLLSLLNCQAFLPASPQTAFYIVCQLDLAHSVAFACKAPKIHFSILQQHTGAHLASSALDRCVQLQTPSAAAWVLLGFNMNKFACCDSLSAPAKLELQTCPISNSPCKVFHQKQLLKGCSAPNARQARCMQHLGSFKVQHAFAHCR